MLQDSDFTEDGKTSEDASFREIATGALLIQNMARLTMILGEILETFL
jgi:hypothetical protein